jgi:hypothetical protein
MSTNKVPQAPTEEKPKTTQVPLTDVGDESPDRLGDVLVAGEMGDLLILALEGLSQKANDHHITSEDFLPVHHFAVFIANELDDLYRKAYCRDTSPEAPPPAAAA